MVGITKTNLQELPQEVQNLVLTTLGIDWFNFTSMSEKTAKEIIKLINDNFPNCLYTLVVYLDDGDVITT